MDPLISVIIPVYNCENYLENAVNSVLNQSYKNIEIILIDDCSRDNSYNLALSLKDKDNRIVVLKTPQNGGASVARNLGLDYCHGEYISYVDSDDYAHPELLMQLYNSLIKNNADISLCGFYKTFKSSIDEYLPLTNKEGFTRSGFECALHLVERDSILYNVLWNKLYKKSLWDDIRFPVGMASEDFHVCYKVLNKASTVSFVPERLYYYYQNPQSVMHTCTDISKFNDTSLDEFNSFLVSNVTDKAELERLLNESLKYRTDSVVEDYFLAYKKKNKERMRDCSSRFEVNYAQMIKNNAPLPMKFKIFAFNKTLYKLGRGLIELRDTILIRLGKDTQGKI